MKYWIPFLGFALGIVLFNVLVGGPLREVVPRILHMLWGAGSMAFLFWLQDEFR